MTHRQKTSPFSSLAIRSGEIFSVRLVQRLINIYRLCCSATTHTDLLLRARDLQIPTQIIHNASILNAVGCSGLQLYNFGQTVSLVFFTDTWKPDSFYDRIAENVRLGLHTLVLLDIKVKEQSEENLARCRYPSSCFFYSPVSECTTLEEEKYTNHHDTCPFLLP